MISGIILAAGLGTRLQPFTLSHPKAMASVAGTPAVGRVFKNLVNAGITNIFVNLHPFPEQIRQYLESIKAQCIDIQYSIEQPLPLETGGGIAKIIRQWNIDDDLAIVHNADIVTNLSIERMLNHHINSHADVSLLVDINRQTTRKLLFNTEYQLEGWHNSSTNAYLPEGIEHKHLIPAAFGGVYILGPAALKAIKSYRAEGEAFSITPFFVDNINNLKIMAYLAEDNCKWHDIGTPEKLQAASDDFSNT